jgi:dTDP-glucose 4,6-dehydratase
MRAVVTGVAGFIGSHLAERLLREGADVVGIDNLSTGQWEHVSFLESVGNFSYSQADISDSASVEGPVDVVFNLACPPSPIDFGPKGLDILRACSDGVRNLLELADEKGATFVHSSTSECYGDPLVHPQPETYWGNVNPIGPRAPYDEGKRFAEALSVTYRRLRGTRVRLYRVFNTYGPRMRIGDGRVLPNFMMQGLRGEPLTVYGDGSQTRSLCYVADLVEGILRLANSDFEEPVNLGSPDEVSIRSLAEEVVSLTGGKSEIRFLPLPEDDPKVRRPDITRARRILGWAPKVSRQDGLALTVDYFKSKLESHF